MSTHPATLHLGSSMMTGFPRPEIHVPLYLVTILFYLLLIPEQANIIPGGVMLSPYRIFLIPIFFSLVRAVLRGRFRFVWPDIAIVFAALWIGLASYMSSHAIFKALIQGGSHVMDIVLPYFAARFAIRSPRDFRIFLIMIAPGVALMGVTVFAESVLGYHLIQPFFALLTGNPNRLGVEFRLGFMRGSASFPHPILAGICLASFLTPYLMSSLRGWPKWMGVAGSVGGFFTMSSAALLGLVVGVALAAYDWLTQRIANLTWRLFLLGASLLYIAVEFSSNSGFYGLLVRYASLNTVSAYNRVLIWRFGTDNVAKHPWFGIGYDDWDRPEWMQWQNSFSVDHFWLLQAIRFGLPVAIMLIIATIGAVAMLAIRSKRFPAADARLMRGVAISLAVFALGATSVALWLNALVWFFSLVGIAVSLASVSPPRHLHKPISTMPERHQRGCA